MGIEEQWLNEFVQGKSLREILQWQQARALTGYTYEELTEIISDTNNEDGLEDEDLDSVNQQVNLLLHLINKYIEETK